MNLIDSCGWLEYFAKGSMGHIYRPVILDRQRLVVPTICMYEVFRRICRQFGDGMAKAAVYNMSEGLVVELDQHLAVWGANLGLEHKLPLADSIILAIARAHNATIWTQDEHFRNIEGVRFCEPEPMQS